MIKYITTCLAAALLFLSFTKEEKKQAKNVIKVLNQNYSYVPSGSMHLDSQTVSVQSFIIFKTEVENLDYQLFLSDLKAKGKLEELKIAQIDTANWSSKKFSMEPYATYYHSHPAYRKYPVVNISKEAALLFCDWLSNHVNQSLPEGQKLKFRLPTKAEWVMAARGGLDLSPYSWGGPYLRNSDGLIMANFLQLDAGNITRDENNEFKIIIDDNNWPSAGSSNDVLAPAESYWPNGFDLYNMCGNAAELLGDRDEVIGGSWRDPGYDVRIESVKKYNGSAINVGFRVVATVIPDQMPWLKVKK